MLSVVHGWVRRQWEGMQGLWLLAPFAILFAPTFATKILVSEIYFYLLMRKAKARQGYGREALFKSMVCHTLGTLMIALGLILLFLDGRDCFVGSCVPAESSGIWSGGLLMALGLGFRGGLWPWSSFLADHFESEASEQGVKFAHFYLTQIYLLLSFLSPEHPFQEGFRLLLVFSIVGAAVLGGVQASIKRSLGHWAQGYLGFLTLCGLAGAKAETGFLLALLYFVLILMMTQLLVESASLKRLLYRDLRGLHHKDRYLGLLWGVPFLAMTAVPFTPSYLLWADLIHRSEGFQIAAWVGLSFFLWLFPLLRLVFLMNREICTGPTGEVAPLALRERGFLIAQGMLLLTLCWLSFI